MIDNAFAWAEQRKLVRTNSVHGEEEARLVLMDEFDVTREHGHQAEQSGVIELEDPWLHSVLNALRQKKKKSKFPTAQDASGSLLNADLPADVDMDPETLAMTAKSKDACKPASAPATQTVRSKDNSSFKRLAYWNPHQSISDPLSRTRNPACA